MKPPAPDDLAAKVTRLADRAQEFIEITELEPYDGTFIGKQIELDGHITGYPERLKYWRQSVAQVPATIPQLFAYLCGARKRNICLIRGAPANLERQPTRKIKAGLYGAEDRRDHGFLDVPTRLFWFDVDGAPVNWRADPEGAIRTLVGLLGEPWASTSFVWFFSAKHGLEREGKRWTGKIIDDSLRVRIFFIAERGLNEAEAKALTNIARVYIPELDTRVCLTTQINYIKRPHWVEHPDRDVLGDIPTIGWVRGKRDSLVVPDNLTHTARWAKAEGHSNSIADHPDAESAVRGIGSDTSVRSHLMAAAQHLLLANPAPDVTSFADHAIAIVSQLRHMVEQHRTEICNNLAQHGRHWGDVVGYFPDNMVDWTHWLLDHPTALKRKTIKLAKQEQAKPDGQATREAIFARVKRTIVRACVNALVNKGSERPPVTLLVTPTGSGKSTLMRAAAVLYVMEHPDKTVVILMPRHKLSDEQIKLLQQEHPDGNYSAAVWRGRHADDPETPDPKHPDKHLKMCQRSEEAKEVEKAMLDVESSLCKRGRGDKTVKCPLYDNCAYQRQKRVKANIWFAAHECAVHEMPKAFGDVGWVIFDESPLDAFIFGMDINEPFTLELDTLRTPITADRARFKGHYEGLMRARKVLYHTLDKLPVPIESHQGAAVLREDLKAFTNPPPGSNDIQRADFYAGMTWSGKVEVDIRPDTPKEQIKIKLQEAAGNGTIKKEVALWELVQLAKNNAVNAAIESGVPPEELIRAIEAAAGNGRYGRIQVHRGKEGRSIRMVGLKPLVKGTQPTGKQLLELEPIRPQTRRQPNPTPISHAFAHLKAAAPPAKRKQTTRGWNVPTLICDATGDAERLKPIWPQLEEAEPHGWEQLPRPSSVRMFQCVDRTISKWAVGVEGKNDKEIARKAEGAKRLYAAVLMKALEYGGADVGVIVYKSTKDWILKNCSVPDWLKLLHWGDLTGTNALQEVRALFVIGRPLASAEAVTRMAEALFGDHIALREYLKQPKGGRIPTTPDAKGNNCILVDVWQHPDPMAERLRRQITEGSLIQAVGRARAGLRGGGEPLDIHLWTDVPLPELGPVEPVLWSELEAGLDGLMLAKEGVWLGNIADAVRAFDGLFSARGLERARAATRNQGRGTRSPHSIYKYIYMQNVDSSVPKRGCLAGPVFRAAYQRAGPGCKPSEAVFLRGGADPRGWLEARLGPLARFEVLGDLADGGIGPEFVEK